MAAEGSPVIKKRHIGLHGSGPMRTLSSIPVAHAASAFSVVTVSGHWLTRSVGVRGRGDVVTQKSVHPRLIADSGYGYAIQVALWGDIADTNTGPLQRQKAKAERQAQQLQHGGPKRHSFTLRVAQEFAGSNSPELSGKPADPGTQDDPASG